MLGTADEPGDGVVLTLTLAKTAPLAWPADQGVMVEYFWRLLDGWVPSPCAADRL